MAYQIYTTDALVCGSYDCITADRSYLLMTRDAGMVYAAARSVREERSKQRYALQDFSRVRVSLVKGKSGWRVGSVESHGNAYYGVSSRKARGSVVAIVRLLRRFVHGEDVDPVVFETVVWALARLQLCEQSECDLIVLLVELRLLAALGYIESRAVLEPFLETPLRDGVLAALKEHASVVRHQLDAAAIASHL